MARYVDYGIYGDGDLYESDLNTALGFTARREAYANYLSVRLHYTSQVSPGNLESFRVLRLSFELAPNRPGDFTYMAFVDKVEATDQISMILHHTGSEFIVENAQLMCSLKRSKGKDV